jgi:AraC-like DNA-binding protein
MPVEPTKPGGHRIPEVRVPGNAIPPGQVLEACSNEFCLFWEIGAPVGPDRHAGALHCWRLANIVFIDCPGCRLRFRCGIEPPSDDWTGLIKLLRICNPHDGAAHLIMGRAVLPLTTTALHLIDIAQEVMVGLAPQSAVLVPYAAAGYDPLRHPSYLRIDRGSATGRILERTLRSLSGALDNTRPEDAAVLADGFAGLLGGLIAKSAESPERPPRNDRRRRIEAYIEKHLGEPSLGAADIERAFGIARSTLYRDFATYGGLDRYIRRRRLERAFIDLTLGETDQGAISAVASRWCFVSLSHFYRLFRATFGIGPSEVLGAALLPGLSAPPPVGTDAQAAADLESVACWLAEVCGR